MKTTGIFAKVRQGLSEEQLVEYSKLSSKEIDSISSLLMQEIVRSVQHQKTNAQIVDYLMDNYDLFLRKIGRSEKRSFIVTFLRSPSDLYELVFPELRKSIIRERYFVEFLSPTRAKMTVEYLFQKGDFEEDREVAYVFTPESHLYMLDVYVDSQKIGLIPHPKLRKYVMSFLSEELADLAAIINEVDQKTNKNPKLSLGEIQVLLQDCLWERRGVSPLCIDAKGLWKKGQGNLSLIEVSYIDGIGQDAVDSRCFIQKSLDLWKEYEVYFYLIPKTDEYPIWIFSKAPEKFHTEIAVRGCSTLARNSTEHKTKGRELNQMSLRDPSFSAFRFSECLTQNKGKENLVPSDANGISIQMSISVPKTLKRWLGLTFWISMVGTIFPLAMIAPYILAKLQLIHNSILEASVLYLMQFLKASFPTIAIFILGLIITARGWLIYEETTFEPLSRKLTSLAILLLLMLVTLSFV